METEPFNGKGVAIWRQIEEALLQDISNGLYNPGDKLPTEAQMAARFSVNRHTVRRALGSLVASGQVRVEQGRGAFVEEETIDYPVGPRTRFTQNIHAAHRMPARRLLRVERVRADRDAADALNLSVGDEVILVQSVNEVDGRPICYAVTILPGWRFGDAIPHIYETSSLTKVLARFGVSDYTRATTKVTAQIPSAEVARHLNLPSARPILQTEGVDVDVNQKPVTYNISQFAGDRVQLVIDATQI